VKSPNVKQTQSINKIPQTCVNECKNERGSDSENFGARISEIEVTVAKIWQKEVARFFL
jgi:hypothetical protein